MVRCGRHDARCACTCRRYRWPQARAGALVAAMVCIWWTLRVLSRLSERSLLAGDIGRGCRRPAFRAAGRRPDRPVLRVLNTALIAAIVFARARRRSCSRRARRRDRSRRARSSAPAPRCSSHASARVTAWLRVPPRSQTTVHRWPVWRIGVRNAADRPGRSVLAIGVIASATFILIAVGRVSPRRHRRRPIASPASAAIRCSSICCCRSSTIRTRRDGREAIGLSRDDRIAIEPFRVLPGDDASCLNLYEPRNPRVLGREPPLHRRRAASRFRAPSRRPMPSARTRGCCSSADLGADDRAGDRRRQLDDLRAAQAARRRRRHHPRHRPLRLRLVAALADSIFQGELLMSDANFARAVSGAGRLPVPARRRARRSRDAGRGRDRSRARRPRRRCGRDDRAARRVPPRREHVLLDVPDARRTRPARRHASVLRRSCCATCSSGAASSRCSARSATAVATSSRSSSPRIVLLLAWGLAIWDRLRVRRDRARDRRARRPSAGHRLRRVAAWCAVFAAGLMSSLVATRAALRTPLLQSLRSE